YREIKRRGFEEQWDAAWRESIEQMRRRGEITEEAAARALGEQLEPDVEGKEIFVREIRDRLASGEMKPQDLDELVEMEWLSADEVDELKRFHERHWAIQDEQNRILAEDIAERERRVLEGRVLGPDVEARPASPSADWARISRRQAAGTGVYGKEIMEKRIEARNLGEFFRAPKGTPVPDGFELLRTGTKYDYIGRKVAPQAEPGLGRAFAAREAIESGPSTWGGARIADAYRAQEAYVDDFIWRVMNDAPGGVRKPPVPPSEFTDEGYDAIMKWADEVADPSREGVKLVCERNAVEMRDFALLDYRHRRNFDTWLSMVMPYHYWYTRTGWNWLQRMATKPAAFNMQTRLHTSLRQANSDLPGRLRDDIGVPAPILKEWVGDKVYIDPARNVFAYLNVYPWAGISDFDYDDPVEAQNAFQEWGDLFERVQGRMFFYYDLPLRWISGEGSEVYYQTPLTAGVKGTSALLREAGVLADTGETLFIPPGGWNIEAQPREWVGLPRAYFTEEEYWPVQHLAMMAALGEITEDEGWDAVYDAVYQGNTDNEAWQEAYQRGAVQRAVSQFGSFWLGQPINIYPKGEEILRKWSAELDKLGYIPGERERGTAEERFAYLEEHAGMSLRSLGWAMMPPKAWMFKDESGMTDVEAYLEEREDWVRAGGRLGALERRYKLREYGKEREAVDVRWVRIQNELIKEGMVPGTRAYRIVDQWYREEILDPLVERHVQYFTGGAEEPPYRASPKEREEWYRQRRAKDLAGEYYAIEPERFQDKEGNTDWDAFYDARQAALDALDPDVRFEVEQYLYRNWIPEEEAMRIVEAEIYAPLSDLIGVLGELEGEERKAAQADLDALKADASAAAARAIADAEVTIKRLHPDWGDAEIERFVYAEIPDFDTWQRRAMEPRRAFEHAFEQFYWSLDAGTRRTLRDEKKAKMAGLSGNYLGKEFEDWEEKNHKLEGLSDVPDVLLLDWLTKTGQMAQLEAEGFPVPGRPLADVLARIPAYEYRVRGEEVPFAGVVGRAGARIGGKVSGELPVPEGPPRTEFDTETERTRELMREAAIDVAVEGEEAKEPAVEATAATFQLPDEQTQARIARATADMDAWVAGGKEGDWTEDMEWWFGDPDSP
ncbi:MAG: hypothetical protein GTO63_25265, partial [Anaerolineae bacterium]|nr:hypothetical protein [Anaerolineae bacterium]NIN98025.1 hypothetical protein [Anaerolineae bacterium]NIQ80974.1 hypothetical protein [Anaerolineae bacterium]